MGMSLNTERSTNDRQRCGACPIRERAICARCDTDELAELDAIKSYRTYAPGREIVAAGEPAPFLGSVVSGVVKLTKTLSDGRRQLVGLLFPSDFLGRAHEPRARFDAVAATETTLCLFERRRFETLITQTPNLEQRLLEMTLSELDASREWLFLLGRKTAREKVATFLCMLARRGAGDRRTGAPVRMTAPLSRDDIADYLGLTIETVSRQMSALKSAGLIVLKDARTIEVPDFDALFAASGDADELS